MYRASSSTLSLMSRGLRAVSRALACFARLFHYGKRIHAGRSQGECKVALGEVHAEKKKIPATLMRKEARALAC